MPLRGSDCQRILNYRCTGAGDGRGGTGAADGAGRGATGAGDVAGRGGPPTGPVAPAPAATPEPTRGGMFNPDPAVMAPRGVLPACGCGILAPGALWSGWSTS